MSTYVNANEHKNKEEIKNLLAAEMESVLEFSTEITRGTFKRYVCDSSLGDLEENLGFSSHHKIGKTMRSEPGVKYFKSALFGMHVVYFTLPDNEKLYLFANTEEIFK